MNGAYQIYFRLLTIWKSTHKTFRYFYFWMKTETFQIPSQFISIPLYMLPDYEVLEIN